MQFKNIDWTRDIFTNKKLPRDPQWIDSWEKHMERLHTFLRKDRMNWKQSFILGLKQAGRVVLVAIIPLVISGLQNDQVDWKSVGITGAIALLMFVDKFINKWDGTSLQGITPIK